MTKPTPQPRQVRYPDGSLRPAMQPGIDPVDGFAIFADGMSHRRWAKAQRAATSDHPAVADDETAEPQALSKMTVSDLHAELDTAGVTYDAEASKADLVNAVKDHRATR